MSRLKKILITAAGGAPALNFVRSLRESKDKFWIVGVDSNKYTLQRAEVDEKFLIPKVKDESYSKVLMDIIKETNVEFLHCQMSYEMIMISELRDKLNLKTFLPSHNTIVTCEDKYASYAYWKKANLPVPETRFLNNEQDLKESFKQFGPKLWLREISGSAGKGSLPTIDFEEAKRWIDLHKGWGKFTAAECLEPETITWQSIWNNGELVVAQGRKRLYWEFSNRTPSGVTGITGTGVTVSDPVVDEIALKAILAIDKKPNGIFGVDLTYNKAGVPNLTEINIGRFFTTHYFFTAAGLNMPDIYVQLGFGEAPEKIEKKINPLPENLAWVRGMDCEPILIPMNKINEYEIALNERISAMK